MVGRYIRTPDISRHLDDIKPGAGREIQLTDAIASLLQEQQVQAYEIKGIRYDCGSKVGYLKATLEYALKHEEVREEFLDYLQSKYCPTSEK